LLFTEVFAMTGGFMKGYGFIPAIVLALCLIGLPGLATAMEVGRRPRISSLRALLRGNSS
jgi:hypothetical protein